MKIVWRNTEELNTLDANPSSRYENQGLASLIESVQDVGIITPLDITQHNTVLDGNRRLWVARKLNIKRVPCIVRSNCNDVITAAQVFKPRSPREQLSMYLHNPEWLPQRARIEHSRAEKAIGREELLYWFDQGGSFQTYAASVRVLNFCAQEVDPATLSMVGRWMLKHKMQRAVREYTSGKKFRKPLSLWRAIENDKPIVVIDENGGSS